MKEFIRHRAFLILISCILLQGSIYGITYNCLGIFTVAICGDCGFSSGDFALLTTLRTLVNALFLMIFPRMIYGKWSGKLRWFILGLGSLLFISFGAGAFTSNVHTWQFIGVLMGIGTGMFSMNQAYILSRWFHKHTNLVIGISGAASGVAGILFNPVASVLVESIGWRKTLLCFCALGLAMIWLGGLRIRYTPEEMGLQPFGAVEPGEKKIRIKEIPKKVNYPAAAFASVILLLFTAYTVHQALSVCVIYLPSYATELKYTLTVASLFTSFMMIGNMGGKALIGVLCDRFDWRAVAVAIHASILLGLVGLLLCRNSLPLLLLCCILVGFSQATGVGLFNVIGSNLFGTGRYIGIFSIIQAFSGVAYSVIYSMAGYSFDATGSFRTGLTVSIAAYALVMILFPVLFLLHSRFGRASDVQEKSE